MPRKRLAIGLGLALGIGAVIAVTDAIVTSDGYVWLLQATPSVNATIQANAPSPDRGNPTPVPAAVPTTAQKTQPTPWPIGSKPTIEEHSALWAAADAALVRFAAQGAWKSLGGPAYRPTSCDLQFYIGSIDDFARALTSLRNVVVPAERARQDKALLPLYQEMDGTMRAIVAAFQNRDEPTAEVEWEHLRLLLGEVTATTRVVQAQGPPLPPKAAATVAVASPTSQRAAVFFRDDFRDPASGFARSSPYPKLSEIGYCNGHYEMRLFAPGAANSWRSSDSLDDFAFELDAELMERKPSGSYNLLFRFKDNENYYTFAVDPNTQKYMLLRRQSNQLHFLKDWSSSEAIHRGTAPNRLKVVAKEDTISAYVNGALLARVQDGTFRSGYVGFAINAWSDPIAARFYDLLLSNADGQ